VNTHKAQNNDKWNYVYQW